MMNDKCSSIYYTVAVFVVTALFDVALNLLPAPAGSVLLRQYFTKHTVLSAALVAGFTGAITFLLITAVLPFLSTGSIVNGLPICSLKNIVLIFFISALIGYPMQMSGFFPHLNEHYYNKPDLPRYQSFIADGLSGLIVASVLWMMYSPESVTSFLTKLWIAVAVLYVAGLYTGLVVYDTAPIEIYESPSDDPNEELVETN